MKPELQQILDTACAELCGQVEVKKTKFYPLMLSKKVLQPEQIEACQEAGPKCQQIQEVLSTLKRQRDECFDLFCEVLTEIGRDDLVKNLLKPSSSSATGYGKAKNQPGGDATQTKYRTVAPDEVDDLECYDDEMSDENGTVDVRKTEPELYDDIILKVHAYQMFKEPRGVACIINIFKTKDETDRRGTEVDCEKLKSLFEQLHFRVIVFNDGDGLTSQEIRDKVKYTASEKVNGAKPQCYVLITLCHGNINLESKEEYILGTDGIPLTKDEILDAMSDSSTKKNLQNVPRLVFFVCCRGDKWPERKKDDRGDAVQMKYKDFLVCFPCRESFVSIRNITLGTQYVRSLVNVFSQHAHDTDVISLLDKAFLKPNLSVWPLIQLRSWMSWMAPWVEQYLVERFRIVSPLPCTDRQSNLREGLQLFFFPGIVR